MGDSTSHIAEPHNAGLPRRWFSNIVFFVFLYTTPVGAQTTHTVEIDVDGHYELLDPFRPRKGRLISPKDIGSDFHNFRFCDGQTAKIELYELIESTACALGHRDGAFKLVTVQLDELVGVKVWTNDYQLIGELGGIKVDELG